MDDLDTTREQLNRQLDDVVAADPLAALSAIGAVQRDIGSRRGAAVRVAVQRHTSGEIGAALGVTKQAAHQKFAKEWAETLKGELEGRGPRVQDRHARGGRDGRGRGGAQARRPDRRAQGRRPQAEVGPRSVSR